ncbi:MAG: DUF2231 domain-containing protein [Akkermansiaceae bacterium]
MKNTLIIPVIFTVIVIFFSPQVFADAQHFKNQPDLTDNAAPPIIPEATEEIAEKDPTNTTRYRTIKYAGKFHPIAVHFPIAFLLGAAFMQWIFVFSKKQQIPPIVTTMLWMGTLGAISAASLGWAYAYDSMYFGEEDLQLLKNHRWLGTGTAVAAVITLLLKHFIKRPLFLALLLSVLAVLVGASAHYGGSLTYGVDNFSDF